MSKTFAIAFALASFLLAVTPGPDMALFVSRTMNWGRSHGFATVLGAVTGIAVHTMLVAFGISVLIVTAPAAFWVLKIVGALYLVYILVLCIVSPRMGPRIPPDPNDPPFARKLWITSTNLIPPVFMIFAVLGSILLGWASPTEAAAIGALGHHSLTAIPIVEAWWGDQYLRVLPGPGRATFTGLAIGTTVSLLSAHGVCEGVGISGVQWPLDQFRLEPLVGLGVSNVTTADTVAVTVATGVLTIVVA